MDTVQCVQCLGTGREFESMSLATGDQKHRTCSACGGSGTVSVERSHFSQYPDVSLNKARELMQVHGKPIRIDIAENEITVLFKDNTRFILGGFTVGYRGTGPDFTKRFLDEAGYKIPMDDIARMKPPISLRPGTAFIPPEDLVVAAPSLEEAKQKAQQSIPADALVTGIRVVYDGEKTILSTGYGTTGEAAIEDARGRMPPGGQIVKQEIQDEYETKHLEGWGESLEAAFMNARSQLPTEMTADEEKVIQGESGGVEEVEQYLDQEYNVRQTAVEKIKSKFRNLEDGDIQVTKVECLRPVRMRGLFARLLNTGDDVPGLFRITWKGTVRVSLKYHLPSRKIAHLTVKPQPSVQVTFQPTARRESCRLCGERFPVSAGRILVRARSDPSMDSVMFMAYERTALWIFSEMGMNLSVLSELRRDVFVCQKCFDAKFVPAAMTFLNENVGLLETAFRENLNQTSDHTGAIEHLGGLAELGFPAAFMKLLGLYQMAPDPGFWKQGIAYWVLERAVKMIKDGSLRGQDLNATARGVITTCLATRIMENKRSGYMWPSLLNTALVLVGAGIASQEDALRLSAGMQDEATKFLSAGVTGEISWGKAEHARKNAEEVLEKIQALQRQTFPGK